MTTTLEFAPTLMVTVAEAVATQLLLTAVLPSVKATGSRSEKFEDGKRIAAALRSGGIPGAIHPDAPTGDDALFLARQDAHGTSPGDRGKIAGRDEDRDRLRVRIHE